MERYDRLRIEITGKCNLLCKYCYNEKFNSDKVSQSEISLDEIKKLIEEGVSLGITNVLLIGGEPLIHKDILGILDYITQKGCSVSITTNGTIITDNVLNKLKECKISRISVSLDGLKSHNEVRVPSDYRKVLENIGKLLKVTPHVHVLTVINEKSKEDLLELYPLLRDLKIEEWAPSHVFVHGRYLENSEELGLRDYDSLFEIYQKLLLKYFEDKKPFKLSIHNVYNSEILSEDYESFDVNSHPCEYYFKDTLSIKPNLDLVLCPNDPSIKANVLSNGGLKPALENRNQNNFFKIKVGDLEECPGCRYLEICGGGCRSEAKRFLGSYLKQDPISCLFMRRVEEMIFPILPESEKRLYEKLIIKEKPYPQFKGKSVSEVINQSKN